jgi:NRPS condensation-like uncharacterized protein
MADKRTSGLDCPAWAKKRYQVEAFDLWHYYLRRYYESCIRTRIDFEGQLDETILAEALKQSCATFPLIACQFDTTPRLRPRWVPRLDATREMLRVVKIPEGACREEVVQHAFANSPSITRGPQLRVLLVRGNARDSLCLISNHMICDGAGFKHYLRELARLYSRITEGLDPSPAPFIRQRGVWPVLRRFAPRDWLLKPSTALEPSSDEIETFRQVSGFPFESGPFSLLTVSLSVEDFRHIRAAAKTRSFTVNDLFMAAFALAWHRVHGIDRIPLSCTLDARGFISPHAKTGLTNLASKCPYLIQIAPGDMMEDIMAKVVEPMRVYKQGIHAARQLAGWEMLTRYIPFRRMDRMSEDLLIFYPLIATNTGIMDEDCVRFGSIAARSILIAPPAELPFSFIIALSTFRDEMTVSTSVEGNDEAKAFAHAILAMMTKELRAFGSRYPIARELEVGHGR